jgi:hypothetical protein
MNCNYAGIKANKSPFEDAFLDGDYPHGDVFQLIGLDLLHHWQNGTLRPLTQNQLPVRSHPHYTQRHKMHECASCLCVFAGRTSAASADCHIPFVLN